MYFAKINKKIKVGKFNESKFFSGYTVKGKGIEYYLINNYDTNLILSLIPDRYKHAFNVREMKINCNIPPHTDALIKCSINFYINSGSCTTNFYDRTDNTKVSPHISAQYNNNKTPVTDARSGYSFKESDLVVAESFVAEDNDVYLIDVCTPHSVYSINNSPINRLALVLNSLTYTFTDTYDMLCETGHITIDDSSLLQTQ